MELLIKQAEVQLDPPLQLTSGFKDRIKTSKGGLNIKSRKDDSIDPIITVGRIEISKELIADLREQIKDDYYVKAFVYLADLTERMTAYEVSKREAEKMMMLGPVIGRVLNEGLGPNVVRTYNIMERGGYFAPLPAGYEDVELEIEYLSPLARAQKATIGQSIDRLVAFMAPLVQLYPEVSDNFNPDGAYRTYSDIYGVPKNVSNGLKEIQVMRAERAKLQQEEMIRNQMLQATQGIKSIADADKAATGDQSILAQIMGGA
jgi:RNA-binding protein YhbY